MTARKCAICAGPIPHRPPSRDENKLCGKPECYAAHLTELRRYREEEARHLLEGGESPLIVAARLGVKPRSLARQLYRAGARDIAILFDRAGKGRLA